MGVWKPAGPATPRPPIIIINDLSYQDSDSSEVEPQSRFEELVVDVAVAHDVPAIESATKAYIVCDRDGPPTVWVENPSPMRVGELHGPGAESVAGVIRAAHTGLIGTLVPAVEGTSAWACRVSIVGTEGTG